MPYTEEILVSTVIATHNRSQLLSEAIKSAENQYVNGVQEIIVVDDNSSDDTPSVVRSFPNVKYVRVKSGRPSVTRNEGIRMANGKYIAFLDDDDVWLPNRLSEAI